MMLKQDLEDIPYLNKAVIEEYADITIISNNGEKYLVNKLLLMSWSQIKGHHLKEVLLSHFDNNEDIIISSDFNSQDIKLFSDFVTEGLLPCSADDIIAGKISDDTLQLFNSFGIDLEHIIGSIPISVNIDFIEEKVKESVDLEPNCEAEDNNFVVERNVQPITEKVAKKPIIIYGLPANYAKENKKKESVHELDKDCDFIENVPPPEEILSKPMIVHGSNSNDNDAKEKEEKELHKMEQKFQCDICQQSNFSEWGLKKHKTWKHGIRESTYRCNVCGETFKSYFLKRYHHKKMHLEPPSNQCKLCPQKFRMPAQLKDHITKDHNGGDFTCELCNEHFSNRYHMYKHLRMEHKKKSCSECKEEFEKIFKLRNHKKLVHGIKHQPITQPDNIECPECGKSVSKPALGKHMKRYHSSNQNLPCNSCDELFKTEWHLKQHLKKDHEKSPCSSCGKMFNKAEMKLHVSGVHSDDSQKPYQCHICKKGFTLFAVLESHVNFRHKGLKQYQCETCGMAFADKNCLRKHMRQVHLGMKRKKVEPKLCKICNKMVVSKDHVNVHTGEKPHKCKYCGQGFAMSGNRSSHEKSVHRGIKRVPKAKSKKVE